MTTIRMATEELLEELTQQMATAMVTAKAEEAAAREALEASHADLNESRSLALESVKNRYEPILIGLEKEIQ